MSTNETFPGPIVVITDVGPTTRPPSGVRDTDPMSEADLDSIFSRVPTNEGHGSVTAARRYEASLRISLAEGRTEELARTAKRALDDAVEGPELERAEERARHGPVWIEQR